MKQIKIKRELWEKIVSGEKKYEFRKLSKGLITGNYNCLDVDLMEDDGLSFYKGTTDLCDSEGYPVDIFPYLLGTVNLRAATLCNPMNKDMSFWYENGDDDNRIDKGTYDFVKENYIDKDIDFIAYQISEIKNATN